jgi:hypothetical protein
MSDPVAEENSNQEPNADVPAFLKPVELGTSQSLLEAAKKTEAPPPTLITFGQLRKAGYDLLISKNFKPEDASWRVARWPYALNEDWLRDIKPFIKEVAEDTHAAEVGKTEPQEAPKTIQQIRDAFDLYTYRGNPDRERLIDKFIIEIPNEQIPTEPTAEASEDASKARNEGIDYLVEKFRIKAEVAADLIDQAVARGKTPYGLPDELSTRISTTKPAEAPAPTTEIPPTEPPAANAEDPTKAADLLSNAPTEEH